jgi:phosphohistidine phosphatase
MPLRVLVIRHAIAADAPSPGPPDELRPLTDKGKRKMRRAAEGLARVLGKDRPDTIATSPLVRARQTADIVADVLGVTQVEPADALAAGAGAAAILRWLSRRRPAGELLAIVGHEPDLSTFIGLAISGEPRSVIELKKGANCLIEFPSAVRAGAAQLRWALQPGQLRMLAGDDG